MTQLHHTILLCLSLFLSLPLSLGTTLPLTFELSPSPAVPPPTPTEPLTLIDNSINTTNENSYDCFKTSPFAPARPLYNDCLSAIRLLPTSTELGLFQYAENPPLATPTRTAVLTVIALATLATHINFPAS